MSDLSKRTRELALLLTGWPSVSGSAGEVALPGLLAERFSHFDLAWTTAVPDDPFGRSNFFALKRGRSKTTIVLTGHFDTVPFDDYGDLGALALSPDRLCAAMIKKLRRSGDSLALRDLESGAFLPGRGLLDMKAGLAAGLAAMEAYGGDASLLFIGVCDEEEKSAGARAAIPMLRQVAETHDLAIKLVINLDAISDQADGSAGRVVTFGSIGKQLLTAFVHGKQVHAGYPQDGVNAAYVAAELVCEFELAQDLSERTGDEIAAPPTVLHAKDLKQGYNVTTPGQAWVYWNTMQHKRSAAEVLALAMKHAKRAVDRAAARTGQAIALMTASRLLGGKAVAVGDHLLSLPDQARLAMVEIVSGADLQGPTVILGFGSIPYPAVELRDQALRQVIADAVRPFGLGSVAYFAGISDMSFFGEAAGDLDVAAANTPIWGTGFVMPEAGSYPCINIGPWGRDYHHWLERLNAPYAFDVLPRVLLAVIDAMARRGQSVS